MAAAHEHGLPVISLSSADVYSAYVGMFNVISLYSILYQLMFFLLSGGAEAEIRSAFSMARQAQPCMLFMDEIDTLVANRCVLYDIYHFLSFCNMFAIFKLCVSRATGGMSGDISVESRVLATLLNEMDGIDGPDSGRL